MVGETLPKATVIIPAPPEQESITAARARQVLDYPADLLEVIVARGRQPSIQRNLALKKASGDFIYFLDDDSDPDPQNLKRAADAFRDPAVSMVGGPSLCPEKSSLWQKAVAAVMGTWLAFGPSRARYRSIGSRRSSSEKELILCNLAARRADVMAMGGFDEKLYPNEENALMDELQQQEKILLYDPAMIIYRPPRATFRAFRRMILNYGRGRAEQFRLHPTFGSAANFVPPLFCVYLLVVGFLPPVCRLPLVVYALAVFLEFVGLLMRGQIRVSLLAALLIPVTHIFYGLGFFWGLFRRVRPSPPALSSSVELQML